MERAGALAALAGLASTARYCSIHRSRTLSVRQRMRVSARSSLLLPLLASCVVPYSDSLAPPRPEVCRISKGWTRRPTACALLVGTVVDAAGRPMPNVTVHYALKDRARDLEGYLLPTQADGQGNFRIMLYRLAGLATYPDTATVRLHGATVSPRQMAAGVPATPRWQGNAEAVVTYVRLGGALTVGTARIVLDHYVPR
jgi:hypothetical protein